MKKLTFTKGNAKLDSSIYIFSLPAAHSCPSADKCKSAADPKTGKIKDGPNTQFRCYAASQEALYKNVRDSRWRNFKLLRKAKTKDKMKELIRNSLPKNAKLIRLHSSGDMFSQQYFDAWMEIAQENPNITFYAYTKSLSFWINRFTQIPKNLKLTASEGGRQDNLIAKHNLKYAKVVFSKKEAKELGLSIDHTDELAYGSNKPFALLLHGVQPGNTPAAKALSALKADGFTGYSKKIPLKTI